jgi:hypothetical protein
MIVRAVFLGFALACVVYNVGAQSAGTFFLRGQVVDALSGRPIPDLKITLANPLNWRLESRPVVSGSDGRFMFTGLSAGRYILQTLYYGEAIHYREFADSSTLTVKAEPSDESTTVVFRVALHPSLSGTVLDELGEPVSGAYVAVFGRQWRNGKVIFDQSASGQTNDLGRFRIAPMQPGAYYVCAYLSGAAARPLGPRSPDIAVVDFPTRPEPRFYKRSCYPAEPPSSFPLDWGQEQEVKIALEPGPVIHVQGRVAISTPHSTSLYLQREHRGPSLPGYIQPDGTFDINVTEPGPSVLRAGPTNPAATSDRLMARKNVLVEGSGTKGIELALEPPGAIDVFVERSGTLPLKQYSVLLGLQDVSDATPVFDISSSQNDHDGSIRFPAVDPGTYWLTTRTEDPFCVESVRLGGSELLHRTVTVASGSALRLDVRLSTTCGAIDGHVIADDKPVAFAKVWLLMSGSAKSPGDMISEMSDEDGAFSFNLLPPGRYSLWAWSQEDPQYIGPASLADVEQLASVVLVSKGQRTVANVAQIPRSGGRK